jgi:hypothetical protein
MSGARFQCALLVAFVLLAQPAWAQYGAPATSITSGSSCTGAPANGSTSFFVLPDSNGHILQCNGSTWSTVNEPAGAAGSTGYVQYNNGGALAGSASLFWDNSDGYLGIGTTSPPAVLAIGSSLTSSFIAPTPDQVQINDSPTVTAAGARSALEVTMQPVPISTSSANFEGVTSDLEVPATATVNYRTLTGLYGAAVNYGSGSVTNLEGLVSNAYHYGSSTVGTAYGLNNNVQARGTGSITTAYGISNTVETAQSSSNIGTAYGIYNQLEVNNGLSSITTGYAGWFGMNLLSGTFGTGYGVYVGNIYGTNKWSLYASDATSPSYFAGNVGVGTTSPPSMLSVYGGGLAVGTYAATANVGVGSAVFSGSVGIGSALPALALDVVGSIRASSQLSGGTLSLASSVATAYTPTGATSGPANPGIQISNSSATDGGLAFLDLKPRNSSANFQNSYIGAVSTTGAGVYSASLVFGQQTGSSAYAERMRIDQNGNVGIGTSSPNASAVLDLSANTTSMLLPVGTAGQQPTCNTALQGAVRYDTTIANAEYCNGLAWIPFKATGAPPGSGYFVASLGTFTGCMGTTISSITYSGSTATLTTSTRHDLSTGDSVTISGTTPAAYSGTFSITVTGATTFTYTPLSNPGGSATAKGTYCPNSGGITQANEICVNDLTGNNTWWGYSPANANGLLTSGHVTAFLCDNSTCNEPDASKTYYFANGSDSGAGGATFTSTAAGLGPNDTALWSQANHFAASVGAWTGRGLGTASLWPATNSGNTCSSWTSNSASVTGTSSFPFGNGTTSRWDYQASACNGVSNLMCLVNP